MVVEEAQKELRRAKKGKPKPRAEEEEGEEEEDEEEAELDPVKLEKKCTKKLTKKLGREPTPEELAKYVAKKLKKVHPSATPNPNPNSNAPSQAQKEADEAKAAKKAEAKEKRVSEEATEANRGFVARQLEKLRNEKNPKAHQPEPKTDTEAIPKPTTKIQGRSQTDPWDCAADGEHRVPWRRQMQLRRPHRSRYGVPRESP